MLRDIPPIGLRVTPELKSMIRASAKAKGRSMNAEILARLETSFAPHVDLQTVPIGQLVRELIDRNEPGKISIEITNSPSVVK